MASKLSKSPSSPKPAQHVGKKGQIEHSSNVPGYDHASGTPGWVSGPARKAAARAK